MTRLEENRYEKLEVALDRTLDAIAEAIADAEHVLGVTEWINLYQNVRSEQYPILAPWEEKYENYVVVDSGGGVVEDIPYTSLDGAFLVDIIEMLYPEEILDSPQVRKPLATLRRYKAVRR